jgi:TolB-like protein/Tfp pilus assembly protein PilF
VIFLQNGARRAMTLRFHDFALDVERRELRRAGEPVQMEPQVFDLLVYLVRNRDHVVSKDEVLAAVWGRRVVCESTLASRINAVRRAIGDDGERQLLVRTYPRKGLRFIADMAAAERTTVMVLPFGNLCQDPSNRHMADGMTEDLIGLLSRHRALTVVGRGSAFGVGACVAEGRLSSGDAAQRVGADYFVEGTVRRSECRVRVTARLVSAESGETLWAEHYDRDARNLFELQDEIAVTVAAQVEPEVTAAEWRRVLRKPPGTLGAWDHFRLGTHAFHQATPASNQEAAAFFRRALELDPKLAEAHGWLSYALVIGMVYHGDDATPARLDEAVEAARTGAELDDQDGLIRFMHGRALLASGSYDDALAELLAARQLNPSLAVAYCGLGDTLAYMGRFADAFGQFDRAIELSPHDPQRWAFCSYRALAHLLAGEPGLALDWTRQAIRVPRCHFWPLVHQVAALGLLGDREQAAAATAALLQRVPGFSTTAARRRLFYIRDTGYLDRYAAGLQQAGVPY